MTENSSQETIFIHSLWRAGSTYVFNAFRRSDAGYWVYQEPIHELALMAKEDLSVFSIYTSERLVNLRHPILDKPYFYELEQNHHAWHDVIEKSIIYDTYFGSDSVEPLEKYLQALIHSANGQPVIQECRTSSRIGLIKQNLGGVHIYLWRNPWDQWWSFKLNDYFNAACQIIIGSHPIPPVIKKLREEVGYTEYHNDNIAYEINHFQALSLTPENSYMVFFTLWCLGLLEGVAYADQLVNIDSLSTSENYRQEITNHFHSLGIEAIDFSDCQMPQGFFDNSDKAFFTRIENRVFGLLLISGYTEETIDTIRQLRIKHTPSTQDDFNTLQRDLRRAREIALRLETNEASHGQHFQRVTADFGAQAKFWESELKASKAQLDNIADKLKKSEAEVRNANETLAQTKIELSGHLQSSQTYLQASQLGVIELAKSHAEREYALNQQLTISLQEFQRLEQQHAQLEKDYAKQEYSLNQQLQKGRQDFQRLEQAQIQLEKEHAEQIKLAEQQQDGLKRALAEREQELKTQLLSIQQQAEQEKAKQSKSHREQVHQLLGQQAEQEQLLTQKLEAAQQELYKVQQDVVTREQLLSKQSSQTRLEVEALLSTLTQREQLVDDERIAIQQQAELDRVQLNESHSEQIQNLQREYNDREQEIRQQLNAVQDELINLQQVFLKREQVLTEQTILARQELETQLRAFAQREQEVALQLVLIQQQAEQEKAEQARIYVEQAKALHSEHSKREKNLSQQLNTNRQEIRNLHKNRVKLERETTEKLLGIQQQAIREKAEQAHVHEEKVRALQHGQAELEKAFKQELQTVQQELLRLTLAGELREKEHSEQALQSRQEQEELKLALAQREQEIAAKILDFQQQAEQETSNQVRIYEEQIQALHDQRVELEQELQAVQQELLRLTLAGELLEKEYAEQALQSRQEQEGLRLALAQQEQEIAAKILDFQRQAEQERADLVSIYEEQIKTLYDEHIEREQALIQGLQSGHQDLLIIEQERIRLEQLLTEQINKSQGEQEDLQRILSQFQQDAAEQLLATEHRNDQEKAALIQGFNELELALQRSHQERESNLNQQLIAKQNELNRIEEDWGRTSSEVAALQNDVHRLNQFRCKQMQQHEAELRNKKDEYDRMAKACSDLEARLKADILSERQTSLLLQQSLAQVQHNLEVTQASLSWRLLAPLFALSQEVIPNKILGSAVKVLKNRGLSHLFEHQENEASSFVIDNLSIEPIMPDIAQSTIPPHIASTLDELLSYHDVQFVHCAFWTLLGRPPDSEGLGYYVGRLRLGFSKMRVVSQLYLSDEGKEHGTRLNHLDKAIDHYQRGQYPIIGKLFRWIDGIEGNSPIERKLRGIENQLILFAGEGNQRFSQLQESLSVVHDFMVQQIQSMSQLERSLADLNKYIEDEAQSLSIFGQSLLESRCFESDSKDALEAVDNCSNNEGVENNPSLLNVEELIAIASTVAQATSQESQEIEEGQEKITSLLTIEELTEISKKLN